MPGVGLTWGCAWPGRVGGGVQRNTDPVYSPGPGSARKTVEFCAEVHELQILPSPPARDCRKQLVGMTPPPARSLAKFYVKYEWSPRFVLSFPTKVRSYKNKPLFHVDKDFTVGRLPPPREEGVRRPLHCMVFRGFRPLILV